MKPFWMAVNEHGQDCEHKHIRMIRAVRCARSQERYFRRKYNERQGLVHRVTFEQVRLK